MAEIEGLSSFASLEPQAAYTAFTNCIHHKYTYFMKTIPDIHNLVKPLENVIRLKLLPALTEIRDCADEERFSL